MRSHLVLSAAPRKFEAADGADLLVAILLAVVEGHTLLIPAFHSAFVQGREAKIGRQIL